MSLTPHLPQSAAELFRALYRIRCFEETVLENFPRGVFFGTTHTYLGQEADAVGVLSHLQEQDIVFSNHRCHGHFLAYGGSPHALFAELMGRATGVCGGRGGSQHLHWRNFYSNGVQGGIAPIATGMALAEKYLQHPSVTVAFLGDGTLGEGVLYEALNLSALGQAPVLWVVEANGIAQTTPTQLALAGDIPARFSAFHIPVEELDTSDVKAILPAAEKLFAAIRLGSGPQALILHTCRFGPHSKGDDTRTIETIAQMKQQRDPVQIQAQHLSATERQEVETSVQSEMGQAYEQALSDPFPQPVEREP